MTVFAFLRQTFRPDQKTGWAEHGSNVFLFVSRVDGEIQPMEGLQKQELLRSLLKCIVRIKAEGDGPLSAFVAETELQLCNNLRRPTETELREGIRHSVVPLLAAIVTP